MPVWTATLPVIGTARGTPVAVFDGEVVTDGQESQAVALPPRGEEGVNIGMDIRFASTPTTVDYQLQIAMENLDASYEDVAAAQVTAVGGGLVFSGNVVARFARIIANDADVEEVTGKLLVN